MANEVKHPELSGVDPPQTAMPLIPILDGPVVKRIQPTPERRRMVWLAVILFSLALAYVIVQACYV